MEVSIKFCDLTFGCVEEKERGRRVPSSEEGRKRGKRYKIILGRDTKKTKGKKIWLNK